MQTSDNKPAIANNIDMSYLPPDKVGNVTLRDLIEARGQLAEYTQAKSQFKAVNADILDAKAERDKDVRETERTLRAMTADYIQNRQGEVLPSNVSFDTDAVLEYDEREVFHWLQRYLVAVLEIDTKTFDKIVKSAIESDDTNQDGVTSFDMSRDEFRDALAKAMLKVIKPKNYLFEKIMRETLTMTAERLQYPDPPNITITSAISVNIGSVVAIDAVDAHTAHLMIDKVYEDIQDIEAVGMFLEQYAPELHVHHSSWVTVQKARAMSNQDEESFTSLDIVGKNAGELKFIHPESIESVSDDSTPSKQEGQGDNDQSTD